MGVARAHAYGTSDHGAAAVAYEHAVDAAGEQPTAKQGADLADYRAQLELGRGETHAGIIDALRAVSLAPEPKDRFYSEMDLANGLRNLAESCDYRPLIDAKTVEDGADASAACRRVVALAQTAYGRAGATAVALGWANLANLMRDYQTGLDRRRQLIDWRASADAQMRHLADVHAAFASRCAGEPGISNLAPLHSRTSPGWPSGQIHSWRRPMP